MSTMTINGRVEPLPEDPDALLIDVVRDTLELTGTKLVCGAGVCGACTVLVDGAPVVSCLMPARAAANKSVTTVEGIGATRLHPVQKAFAECHGLQCGYCTPGMIMAASDLLRENPHPSDEEIREGLEGNLCRCTGYENIVRAVRRAAQAGVSQ